MTEWWIDDASNAGPQEENVPTPIQAFLRFQAAISKIGNNLPKGPMPYFNDEAAVQRFYEAERAMKKITEAHEQRMESIEKREIGKGRVKGHGPRAKTTFGRGGRKQY